MTTTPQRCRGRRCRAAGRVGTAPRYYARARPVADGAEVYPPHAAGAARPGYVLPGGSPHAPFRSRSSSEAGYFPRRSMDRLPGLLRGLGVERRTPAGADSHRAIHSARPTGGFPAVPSVADSSREVGTADRESHDEEELRGHPRSEMLDGQSRGHSWRLCRVPRRVRDCGPGAVSGAGPAVQCAHRNAG